MSVTAIVLLCIYGVGWLFCSLCFGFSFLLGLGFNQDNMDTFFSESVKLFFVCLFGIWFWPIALPILGWHSNKDNKRIKQSNEQYWAKIAAGENFGKRMVIADVPAFLADYVNTEVTIVRWEVPGNFGMQREVRPVDKWPSGTSHDMIWSASSLADVVD